MAQRSQWIELLFAKRSGTHLRPRSRPHGRESLGRLAERHSSNVQECTCESLRRHRRNAWNCRGNGEVRGNNRAAPAREALSQWRLCNCGRVYLGSLLYVFWKDVVELTVPTDLRGPLVEAFAATVQFGPFGQLHNCAQTNAPIEIWNYLNCRDIPR